MKFYKIGMIALVLSCLVSCVTNKSMDSEPVATEQTMSQFPVSADEAASTDASKMIAPAVF